MRDINSELQSAIEDRNLLFKNVPFCFFACLHLNGWSLV